MTNHFHLIIETPDKNLDRIMNYLMREFSKTVGLKSGRINHVFGGRYKGCVIGNALYFANAYKYILRNPVSAGLVENVQDYLYSTLQREINGETLISAEPICSNSLGRLIPHDLTQRLDG